MGRCRRSRRRGRTNMPPPHSWGGVGGADGGAEPSSPQRVVESDYTRNRELRPPQDTYLMGPTDARPPPDQRPRGRAPFQPPPDRDREPDRVRLLGQADRADASSLPAHGTDPARASLRGEQGPQPRAGGPHLGARGTPVIDAAGEVTCVWSQGLMFWFRRKKLPGSYLRLSATRRSYFARP